MQRFAKTRVAGLFACHWHQGDLGVGPVKGCRQGKGKVTQAKYVTVGRRGQEMTWRVLRDPKLCHCRMFCVVYFIFLCTHTPPPPKILS